VSPTDGDRLAIEGAAPLVPEGPPPWPPPWETVREALAAAYADGSWGRYHGLHGERLRQSLQALCGTQHSWLCSSGTLAVELALRGLRIGPGDEVILAAYDFPGNFRAIEAVGARPVLVDLEPNSWTLDPEQVAEAAGPKTKAVIASHLHGALADMPRLCEIARRQRLFLVEDACQAPGAVVAGRPAGSWGEVGVLSFGGSKLLTAGRGGALVTRDEQILQRVKIYCERGNDAFAMSELQAAVLVPQIPTLAAANAARLRAVQRLLAACGELTDLAPLRLPAEPSCAPAFYKLPWLLDGSPSACHAAKLEQLRRQFIAAAQAEGVAIDEGFRGFVHRTSQRCRVHGDLSAARKAATGTVLLHHPVLLASEDTILRVARAIRKVASRLAIWRAAEATP
jgi:dTDP-4-amino-4,6-dideoxygalactose transaminase